ncbi:MAG: hypothetical protein MI867_20350, partial [Pseudomonadales bacterium]|nr:hypothetical protein [Pseudomonadales bacterium]
MREYFIRYINEQEYQEAIDGKMNKGVSWHITPYSSSDLDEVFKIRDNFSSRKEYLEDTREDAPSWLEEGEYDIVDDAVRQRLDGLCGFPLDAGND